MKCVIILNFNATCDLFLRTFHSMSWETSRCPGGNLSPRCTTFTLSVKRLFGLPWANVLLCTGQQTPDHEERRNPDTQPQDVQQVQEEQKGRGRLRRALQVHAGQVFTLWWCTWPHHPHGPHGSPAPFQPLWTHAAYTDTHSPIIRSPPPHQPLACLGWTTLSLLCL